MIQISGINKQDCIGCSACVQVCPIECISMQADEEGFLYPVVADNKCIECGKCEKVCPCIYDFSKESSLDEPIAYGGFHKEESVRDDSSSGGAFTLFAKEVLDNNGVVCGCGLNNELKPVHIFVDSVDDIYKLRGSKYVQSDLKDSYSRIKDFLESGKRVLFIGTPCQCGGLKSYLGEDHHNLLIVDFICHGVPSPKVFKEYLIYLEKKAGSKVIGFRFRNKDTGWNQAGLHQGTLIKYENGTAIRKHPAFRDAFMNAFLSELCMRPACHACRFKVLPKRTADITIADFWGVNSVAPELNDKKGTSLILLHSQKGAGAFEAVRSGMVCKEVSCREALKHNLSMLKPARPHPSRERFFETLQKNGYEVAQRKYLSSFSWAFYRAMKMVWRMVDKVARLILGPILRRVFPNWGDRNWEELFRFLKFSMIGVSNVIVSYTINIATLLILRGLRWNYDYMAANCVAFFLSVLWSYNLNSRYVFMMQSGERRSTFKTLLKTYAVYAFSGIVLNNAMGTLWIQVVGISKFLSPLLNLCISVPLNYLLNKFWAFRTATQET